MMKVEDVKKVGVIGAGVMGPTIAAVVAPKYTVVVKELNKELAEKGFQSISGCFPGLVKRNVITEVQREVALSQVSMTTNLKDLKDCQIIIDAVPDIKELKISNFAELNKICPSDTIFTTTSSLMSVTGLAEGSGRSDRFIGTHFSNPAHLMALVEVAPAIQTSQETIDLTMGFLKALGKTPVECKDTPGYVVNYLFFPFLVQAVEALEKGLGTVEEIDTAVRLGLGHPMGPFELMDMFGINSQVAGLEAIYKQLNDVRYACPSILTKLSEAGYLGRSAGKGFYTYDERGKKVGVTKLPW